jgi:N-acyl-D-amino-acid deacylase
MRHQVIVWLLALIGPLPAAEPVAEVRPAVARAHTLLVQSSARWLSKKSCFACHHQTLPALAMQATARLGFAQPTAWAADQVEHTLAYFADRHTALTTGGYIPGGSMTVSSALWVLALTDQPRSARTQPLADYLLAVQQADGSWWTSCARPPLQGSRVGATVLALAMLRRYASPEQADAVAQATSRADAWLASAPLSDTDDRFWRLWDYAQRHPTARGRAAELVQLRAEQRADGGWGQTAKLDSDAYATGQALLALRGAEVPTTDPAVQKAARWLLRTQCADGSWRVATRVKPVQPDYDHGDPHGKDQFISIAATAWATTALAQLGTPEK